jgi:hypothetical protein
MSRLQERESPLHNLMMSERNTLRGAITFALWTKYEMQLPESPWQMAGVIVKQLELEGYVKPDD